MATQTTLFRIRIGARVALLGALTCCAALLMTPVSADATSKALRSRAVEMSEEAGKLFNGGKYREAAERIEQAYALDPSVLVRLRNAGRAWEEAKEPERAIHCFERFLERETDPALRKDAEERIARLRAEIAARTDAEAKPSAAATEAPAVAAHADVATPNRTLPWILAGVGTACGLTGIGWIIRVQVADGVISDAQGKSQYDYPAGEAKFRDDKAALSQNRAVALGLIGAGALAGGAAYVLWPRAADATVTVLPFTGRSTGLAIAGQF